MMAEYWLCVTVGLLAISCLRSLTVMSSALRASRSAEVSL